MKKTTISLFKSAIMLLGIVSLTTMYSCDKDDDPKQEEEVLAPIASFQFEVDETNYLQVTFTNYSQNATAYSWNFGDEETSTEESPVHVYAEAGSYTVVLTATNADDVSATYEATIEITDPNVALKLLTGEVSKTWKLYREGKAMWMDPYWTDGLSNDGARPCLYKQELTFHFDGTYVFDDKGGFWAEYGVFNNNDCDANVQAEACLDVTGGVLVNACGDDVSAWLSGTHAFEYDVANGKLSLTGMGAWIGVPKLGTTGETIIPVENVICDIAIEAMEGFDVMTINFSYEGDIVWTIKYASYSTATEPELVETEAPWGEDLADVTPTGMEFDIDFSAVPTGMLDTINSGSTIVYGVDDPADGAAAKVGEFTRTEGVDWQELQFRTNPAKDMLLTNFTQVSVEVYVPATTVFEGSLANKIVIGFGDMSETKAGWWTDNVEYSAVDALVTDTWTTITYTFTGTDVLTRTDLDMMYIGIGDGGHGTGATFYLRNLKFE